MTFHLHAEKPCSHGLPLCTAAFVYSSVHRYLRYTIGLIIPLPVYSVKLGQPLAQQFLYKISRTIQRIFCSFRHNIPAIQNLLLALLEGKFYNILSELLANLTLEKPVLNRRKTSDYTEVILVSIINTRKSISAPPMHTGTLVLFFDKYRNLSGSCWFLSVSR